MKDFLRQNGILLIVAAVLAAVVLSLCSSLLGFNPLSNLLGVIATPFRAAVTSVTEWLDDRYDYAFHYDELLEENAALKQQLAEAQKELEEAQDANRQNELLRELLGLSEKHSDFVFEDARVTARSTSNWASTLTINKGSGSDVEVGDCVIDAYGNLVGIVSEVGFNYAVVSTVIDPTTELGGRIARTDDDAVLQGDFTLMRSGRLRLSYLSDDAQLLAGDRISTSGLGDLYPAGLVAGVVESVHTDADGLSRYAVVAPAADLENVRYVFVIKDFDVVS